jgi:hypothetical protein
LSKYLVYAPVDYVTGYLRYGHFEAEIEIPDDKLDDEEWIAGQVRKFGDLLVDDYRVDDYGEIESLELTKLEEGTDDE